MLQRKRALLFFNANRRFCVSVTSASYASCKVKSNSLLCLSTKRKLYSAYSQKFTLHLALLFEISLDLQHDHFWKPQNRQCSLLNVAHFRENEAGLKAKLCAYRCGTMITRHTDQASLWKWGSVLFTKRKRNRRAFPSRRLLCLLCVVRSFDTEWWMEDTVH